MSSFYVCKSLHNSHSSFTFLTFPSSKHPFTFNINSCMRPSRFISLHTYSNHTSSSSETVEFINSNQRVSETVKTDNKTVNTDENINLHISAETLDRKHYPTALKDSRHSRGKEGSETVGISENDEIETEKVCEKVKSDESINVDVSSETLQQQYYPSALKGSRHEGSETLDLRNSREIVKEGVVKRVKNDGKWVRSGERFNLGKVNDDIGAFFTDDTVGFRNDSEIGKDKKVKSGENFNLGQRIIDIVRNDSDNSNFGRSLFYSNGENSKEKVGKRVVYDSRKVKNGERFNLGERNSKGNDGRVGFDRGQKRENNNGDSGWSRERGSKTGRNGGRNDFWRRSEMGGGNGSNENKGRKEDRVSVIIKDRKFDNDSKEKRKKRMSKEKKADSPEFQLRIGLDMCSKMGNVMKAISLYDSAVKDGIKMAQYQYTVLLYLCSSASMGVIRPAKSGSGSRSLDKVASYDSEEEEENDDLSEKSKVNEIWVSDDVKKYALKKGFEVYERMCSEKIEMNEATLTSVARMAMAMGDGDMAFNMVKEMKSVGISPKLRSYGPALSVFSSNGELEKAFDVEKHMLENGVFPEEPELEALLRVSIQSDKADKVYYVLHKLRTNVRSVSPSTAEVIEKWFSSRYASRVGKRKWDAELLARTVENVGGGWHGLGWLGSGKWTVSRTTIGSDGLCKCCGEKLALIDLDPIETDKFAESVASIAIKRDKNSSFQKFQGWLDYYGPFEAVVDAANVGLFNQRKFKPSKVNAVVNGIRQVLPSKKWPLIILHNRRVTGGKMEEPMNKAVVDRWINADALYATPTGSNDDWYWLYAAIKFKCLLVTNDEMRDHTFQLLGNDFFPKWKERHQVRFSFSEIGPVFHMPPPCSVVIQESDRGFWHVPIASEQQSEGDRIWLCISRPKLLVMQKDSEEVNQGA